MRERMLVHGRARGRLGRIVGSVNPLIPKPGTAYQWLPMEAIKETDRKIARLRKLMSGIDNVYFTIKSERHWSYQALLSLGDRRVAPTIVAAERNGGQWRAAVAETGLDADAFIFRDRREDARLPWDIIDGGLKQGFFRSEFDKSMRAEWTLPPKRARENQILIPDALAFLGPGHAGIGTKILTREVVVDVGVARNGRRPAFGAVPRPKSVARLPAALHNRALPGAGEAPYAFHAPTVRVSRKFSLATVPAASPASRRLAARTRATASWRFSRASSSVEPWVFAPGDSSTKPIIRRGSFGTRQSVEGPSPYDREFHFIRLTRSRPGRLAWCPIWH